MWKYDAAYKAITDKVKKIGGSQIWDGTTSFYVLESGKSAVAIKNALYSPDAVRTTDEIVVIDLNSDDWALWPATIPAKLKALLNKR